jgi:Na+/H+-dicarboxylate symporter
MMPAEANPSIIGIESCSREQFTLQLIFLAICFAFMYMAMKMNQEEQHLKMRYGVNIASGDIRYEGEALY